MVVDEADLLFSFGSPGAAGFLHGLPKLIPQRQYDAKRFAQDFCCADLAQRVFRGCRRYPFPQVGVKQDVSASKSVNDIFYAFWGVRKVS